MFISSCKIIMHDAVADVGIDPPDWDREGDYIITPNQDASIVEPPH